jgi:MerR family transcriptional regulator, redox-sensitive transcriptional activator SoxR
VEALTIGEAARRAGVRASALRYYESVGLLPVPRRVNGRRRYDAEILRILAVIRLAKQAGFTVAETRTLLHGFSARTPPSARWRTLARRKLAEVDALIARAERMKRVLATVLECECPRLSDCGDLDGDEYCRGIEPAARRPELPLGPRST